MISLRALEPEDLDFLYEMENDERVWSVSASRTHFSRFALRQYLAGQPADAFQAGELRLVIADGKEAVGLIDLTNFSPMDGRAEVCIVICPAHRGKGYARQICTGLLCKGMEKGAQKAYLQVVENNLPAQKLYESLGFQYFYTYWFRILSQNPELENN